MAYVIAEPCIGTKDTACVDACPVDCIHPKKDDDKYGAEEMLYLFQRNLVIFEQQERQLRPLISPQ